jgi:ribose transport system permease protein
MAAAVGIGMIMSLVITRFKISSFIITLAFGMIFNGFALLLMPRPGGNISKILAVVIKGNPILVPNSLLILIGTLLLWKLFKKSRYGLHMYAVGGNEYSAFASGINVHRSKMTAYVCSSVFIAAAAIVLCGKSLLGDPTIGDGFPLTSVSGAVLGGALFSGGVGTMKGAIAGGALMAILLNILFFLNVDSAYQYIAQGAILFASIAFTMMKTDKKQ